MTVWLVTVNCLNSHSPWVARTSLVNSVMRVESTKERRNISSAKKRIKKYHNPQIGKKCPPQSSSSYNPSIHFQTLCMWSRHGVGVRAKMLRLLDLHTSPPNCQGGYQVAPSPAETHSPSSMSLVFFFVASEEGRA